MLPHRLAIEQHLKERLGELFALDYDLLLYDVTSTYFEGLAPNNPLAQRGYSSDHRVAWLKKTGRRYLIGTSRGEIKQWSRELAEARDWHQVRDGIEARVCAGPDGNETFLLCRSAERREKEAL